MPFRYRFPGQRDARVLHVCCCMEGRHMSKRYCIGRECCYHDMAYTPVSTLCEVRLAAILQSRPGSKSRNVSITFSQTKEV
jgi:hypothetical protein